MRFADKQLERFWRTGRYPFTFPNKLEHVLMRKLQMLDAADYPQALRIPPGNNFEELRGKAEGHYSIRVNKQWRLVFTWKDEEAHDVIFTDYHR